MTVSTPTADELQALLADVDPAGEMAPCHLHELVLGSDTLAEVGEVVTRHLAARGGEGRRARVCLLVDRTPMSRQGADVKAYVESELSRRFDVTTTVLDDGQPELHVVAEVLEEAARAAGIADAVVAMGGGTISDIAKLATRGDEGEPGPVLVSVQTAASVDGYTDDVSVVLKDGVKRTVPSRWPDAVLADAETIAEAPAAMNRAGFGEMTSMLVAPADWRLASLTGVDESFIWGPVRLLGVVGEDLDAWSPGVKEADPDAVAGLTRALALRGIATGVAGTTAVLSGVEHLVSHMLDQHHTRHHLPMGLHGAQVGVASVVAAAAWEMLFDRMESGAPVVDEAVLDPGRARAAVSAAFGDLDPSGGVADECWRDYQRKLNAVSGARPRWEALLAEWPDHVEELRSLVRPAAGIGAALRRAGAVTRFEELDPQVGPELARWAVAHCALMRNRFTVVDLLMLLGWWGPVDVDEVFARAAAAVAPGATESDR